MRRATPAKPAPSTPAGAESGRRYNRIIVIVYRILFFLSWGLFLAAFLLFQNFKRTGSPVQTQQKSAVIVDHGARYFVPALQARVYNDLLIGSFIAIPLLLIAGFVLQFGFKIPVFSAGVDKSVSTGKPRKKVG